LGCLQTALEARTKNAVENKVWFSSYQEGTTPKLAATIADVSEQETVPVGIGSAGSVNHERALLN